MKNYFQQKGDMPYQVSLSAKLIGDDLVVLVWGGEKPHVGAVAIAIPRPSLKNPEATSATTSVYAMLGHKEDNLARAMAQQVAAALNKNVILTAGVHVENILPEGIKVIEANCSGLQRELISYYKS